MIKYVLQSASLLGYLSSGLRQLPLVRVRHAGTHINQNKQTTISTSGKKTLTGPQRETQVCICDMTLTITEPLLPNKIQYSCFEGRDASPSPYPFGERVLGEMVSEC